MYWTFCTNMMDFSFRDKKLSCNNFTGTPKKTKMAQK